MSRALVISIIGEDRPGLIEALSEVVALHGWSWEESRMARLAGHFAGVLQVRISVDRAEALAAALPGLAERGLHASVVDSDLPLPEAAGHEPLALELVGQDRPGIVRDISAALAGIRVNVIELVTSVESAPMSGEPLFRARAQLRLPESVSVEDVSAALEKIADDLMADLTLGAGG